MFELKISRVELEDLIIKMSIPKGNKFVFETVAPVISPKGYLEWIGRSSNYVAWIRAKGLEVSGIDEPVIIAFEAHHLNPSRAKIVERTLLSQLRTISKTESIFLHPTKLSLKG
jgi:hypothetical protein